MEPSRALVARVDSHSAYRALLTERAQAQVLRVVAGFDGWYDHDAISRMTAEVVKYVEAAQRGVAVATDAYLAQVATEIVGRTVRPVGSIDPSELREGITHQGAYGRLADQYRYRTSLGLPQDQVMAGVIDRLGVLVATDMALAFTHQARRVMESSPLISGYRRIVRPEMSNGGACGLCLAASDRWYSRGDLLPLHDRCVCTVLPIRGDDDPGRLLNRDELDRLYEDAGTTRRDDLVKTRYRIEKNGEIGPVLVNEKHAHRGPRDL